MSTNRQPKRILSSIVWVALVLVAGCGGAPEEQPAPSAPEAPPSQEAAETAPPAGAGEPGELGSAKIAGVVHYEGEVPQLPAIKMDADPGCAKKHDSPVRSEALVLGEGKTMANVFVRVKSGLPGGSYDPPAEPAVLDQKGCRYIPHVLGLMTGQTLKIMNSDGLLHNVHALPEKNKTFNLAMPASRTEATVTFSEEEFMFRIKCDVHPWMGAYVSVMSHPFFDVTEKDGQFEIDRLPAGSYEIEAWHEKLGTETQTVEVADGETVELAFTLTR